MSKIVNSSNRKAPCVKRYLTRQAADKIICKTISNATGEPFNEKSSFSQVVLRRSYCALPEKVPFFAYTVERRGLIYILQAEMGSPTTVFVVPSGHIRSISDGRSKVAKLHAGK